MTRHAFNTLSPADRPYVPLTQHEKFRRFTRSLYSPYALASGAYSATWDQATGSNYAYGGGMEGWGKRLGSVYADTATHQFFGVFLFPTLLHQDPRYFAIYHGSIRGRVAHALERIVVTRSDDGHDVFNYSGLLGIAASASAANLWLPVRQRTWSNTGNRMLGGLQGAATNYLLREFTPDLLRFFQRHAPTPLRRVEQKIPAQMITGTPPGEE